MINRLIEDLINRGRCLHAEAEVFMESQIRTNGQNNFHNSLFLDRSQNLTSSNNFNTEGSFSQPRQRQSWDISNYLAMNNVPLYNYDDEIFFSSAQLNQSQQNTDRNGPPVPARSLPPPPVTSDISKHFFKIQINDCLFEILISNYFLQNKTWEPSTIRPVHKQTHIIHQQNRT